MVSRSGGESWNYTTIRPEETRDFCTQCALVRFLRSHRCGTDARPGGDGGGKGRWAFAGGAVKFTGGVYAGKSAPYSDEGSWHKLQMNACANGAHMIGSKPK